MGYLALPEATWDSLVARVASAATRLRWAWGALRQPDDTWDLVVLSVRGGGTRRRALLHYRDLILCAEQLSPAKAADRLRRGVVSHGRKGEPALSFPLSNPNVHPVWRTTESGDYWDSRSGWPEYYVAYDLPSRSDRRIILQNISHLVAEGLPVFVDGMSAVAEFVYEEPRERLGNDASPRVLVTLPDSRGRIDRMTFDGTRVRVAMRGSALASCRIRTTWRDTRETRAERFDEHLAGSRSVDIPTGPLPDSMAIFLCDKNGAILDRREWHDARGERPVDLRPARDQVRQIIASGESSEVEFKQLLGEDKVNASFARTVSAFANASGGRILVGVAPDTSVLGWAPKDGADQITNIVRDNVRELPPFRSYPVKMGSKRIFVVEEGASKPYLSRDVCYIRVQATTRKAKPHEIAALTPPPRPRSPLDGLLGG